MNDVIVQYTVYSTTQFILNVYSKFAKYLQFDSVYSSCTFAEYTHTYHITKYRTLEGVDFHRIGMLVEIVDFEHVKTDLPKENPVYLFGKIRCSLRSYKPSTFVGGKNLVFYPPLPHL